MTLAQALAIAVAAAVVAIVILEWRQASRLERLEAAFRALARGQRIEPDEGDDAFGRVARASLRLAANQEERLVQIERQRDERDRILEHMSDGVALLDSDGRVVHANHRLAALLGRPRPPEPGTRLLEATRTPELDELFGHSRREHRTVEADLQLWGLVPRTLRATVTPLGENGDAAALLVLHDLTEAERLGRVRQDFVANVSHELRTPLTSLRGYVETLLDGGLEDRDHRRQFVEILRDQTVRLQALVEDLLTLAEIERPDSVLRIEPFDLRDLAAAQVAAFREPARRAGLELILDPGDAMPVAADRDRLAQVFANLLDNAIKYTPRGGVVVRVGGDEAIAWGEIRDTGPGIAPEHQSRVFERFYRVDRARSRVGGGTGLGLSIVKHIIERHEGRIVLESEPDRGAAFRFEFPRGPAQV